MRAGVWKARGKHKWPQFAFPHQGKEKQAQWSIGGDEQRHAACKRATIGWELKGSASTYKDLTLTSRRAQCEEEKTARRLYGQRRRRLARHWAAKQRLLSHQALFYRFNVAQKIGPFGLKENVRSGVSHAYLESPVEQGRASIFKQQHNNTQSFEQLSFKNTNLLLFLQVWPKEVTAALLSSPPQGPEGEK